MSKLQVKKSNFLVPLEEAVSKPAQLLASYLVASLPKSKIVEGKLPQLKFSYRELRRAINADGRERVNKIQDVFDLGVELQRCVLFYEDNVSKKTVSWLIDQDQSKLDNVFTYTLHPGLKKHLLNVEKHFTKYNYLFRVCLNAHAMKLYEILKMYQYLGEVVLNIEEEIKPSLGLAGKYPKVYDFKRRVLNIAQEEIKKYTDIRFDYEVEDKKGKTPISFRFFIHANQPTDLPVEILGKFKMEGGIVADMMTLPDGKKENEAKAFPAIYEKLERWGGKKSKIKELIATYGDRAIQYQIVHLERILKSKKPIENPFAWLIKALKEDYQDTVQNQKEQKKLKQDARLKQNATKKKVEDKLEAIRKAYYQKKRVQCNLLIKENPRLLADTIESIKGLMTVSSALQKGHTHEEIYNAVFTKRSIEKKIEETYPERFDAIEKEYSPQITKLKKQLEQM